MKVKQLIEMFKYYTTGVEEREIFVFIVCAYDNTELYCYKMEDLKEQALLNKEIKCWCINSVFGRDVVYIKVLNNR